MSYQIAYTRDALADLRHEGRTIESNVRRATTRYLEDHPGEASNIRKPLDANPLDATWELRLNDVRVYYDIEEAAQVVRVLRVGRKFREAVFLRGQPYEMRFRRMAQTAKARRLHVDDEARALMANQEFRKVLARSKRTPQEELVLAEDLDRERPLTAAEVAEAEAWLDRLEHESDGERTPSDG